MKDFLRFNYVEDSDGTGELYSVGAAGGFSGQSSAYVTTNEITCFAEALIEGNFSRAGGLRLEGGKREISKSSGNFDIVEVWVGIYVYPVGALGRVGVRIVLRRGVFEADELGCQQNVTLELRSDYEPLRAFGQSILHMLSGKSDSSELDAGPFE